MSGKLVLGLAAAAALVPATVLALHRRDGPGPLFWPSLFAALAGPLAWAAAQALHGWKAGLSGALWMAVSASLVLYAGLAARARHAWRLAPLLFPYLLLLAVMAAVWERAPAKPFLGTAPAAWLSLHILVSIAAYGLLTLASVAGLAVFLQERGIKLKRRGRLAPILPSVADGEALQAPLLAAAGIVLAVGLVSGMATEYYETAAALRLDHKTLLSLLTFAVICALWLAHHRMGLRGRRAARLVLLAYLLLTLAYPGAKFVTDVLLA